MLLQELMRRRASLTGAERSIADYILVQREKVAHISARQIAREVFAAPSTVVRFCQKFGYAGYDDFREAFLVELHYLTSHFTSVDPNVPFGFGERRGVIAHKMGALYREVVDDTLGLLAEDVLDRAVGALDAAEDVCVFSIGVQADIAQGFRDKMLKIGRSVTIETRANAAFYRAAHADPARSLFILLSYSGETEQLLRVARKLNERTVPLIAITSFGGNSLSALADIVLYVSTREKLERNIGHFAMNVSTMLLLDTLYACIFNENRYVNFESRVEMRQQFEAWRTSSNPLLADEPSAPSSDAAQALRRADETA